MARHLRRRGCVGVLLWEGVVKKDKYPLPYDRWIRDNGIFREDVPMYLDPSKGYQVVQGQLSKMRWVVMPYPGPFPKGSVYEVFDTPTEAMKWVDDNVLPKWRRCVDETS